jgi:glycosyltransferase involved in cell wall biosynthesis
MEISNSPLISIIIPCYNRADLIGETLDSIITQTYQNWECIIVDDGSTDNSIAVIKNYIENDKRFRLYLRDREPKGANTCRNIGYEKATGDFIQFFDSDDLMHNELLNKKIDIIKKNPDTELVLCKHKIFPETHSLSKFKVNISSYNYLSDFVAEKVKLNTPNTLIKKDILIKTGVFNPYLIRAQEVEFYTRILIYTNKIKVIDEELIFVRAHDSSITGSFMKKNPKYILSDIISRLLIFEHISKQKKPIDYIAYCHLREVVTTDFHQFIKQKNWKFYFITITKLLRSRLLKGHISHLCIMSIWGMAYMLTNKFQNKLYQSLLKLKTCN